MKKSVVIGLVILGVFILGLLGLGGWIMGSYNSLVSSEESVNTGWAQVENVYQRRADLIPNLVEIVKGYATHEKSTLESVIKARASATASTIDPTKMTGKQLAEFQANQGNLSQALGRLMVSIEKYPDLKANQNFLQLQAQLEGTENRIAVERKNYNDLAKAYNISRRTFPTMIIANFMGFGEKPYFEADKGAKTAPKIKF